MKESYNEASNEKFQKNRQKLKLNNINNDIFESSGTEI